MSPIPLDQLRKYVPRDPNEIVGRGSQRDKIICVVRLFLNRKWKKMTLRRKKGKIIIDVKTKVVK